MGYWMFIFNHQEWYELYEKNCSLKTQEEWLAEGKPNIYIGIAYFIAGLLFELSYLPFMIAMAKKEFFQHSCYKFMFMMGIYDIFILPCNGIITGIQVMKGEHFCNNPKLYYLTGAIGVVGFYGVTTLCVILAFNRFLEMGFPKFSTYVFGGFKTYLWMCVPILYQGYVGFHVTHIFDIKIYAMHHDPYHLIHGMENNPNFNFQRFQRFFSWNNSLIIAFLTIFYGGLLIVTKIQTRMATKSTISKVQKQMTIQAICVCGEMFAAPLIHIFMLFWEFPVFIEILAHFSWICLHGDTPIIYFILNKSLRNAVFQMSSTISKFSNSFIKNSFASLNRVEPSISYIFRPSQKMGSKKITPHM